MESPLTYKDRLVSDMTREELVEAVHNMYEMLEQTRKNLTDFIALDAEIERTRRVLESRHVPEVRI